MSRASTIMRRRLRRRQNKGSTAKTIAKTAGILLTLTVVTIFTFITIIVLSVAAIYTTITSNLPRDFTDIETLGQNTETFETSKIYAWNNAQHSSDTTLIYEIIDPSGGDRQWLAYEQIPANIAHATIAIEDKTYWTNSGFDLEGIGRAFYEFVLEGGAIQGGSSITQQVVKNNLIAPERRTVGATIKLTDYRRKVDELFLARELSRVYTKEQILEWYLNSNFYGNLAYGIEAAARVYFDKPAAQLTLAEAAMLAAIPQSPAFNPIDNPEPAKLRQQLVLDAMLRDDLISAAEHEIALAAPLEIRETVADRFDIISPHFALYARQQVEQMFGAELLLRGGLRVFTSLDLEMQQQAQCVARAHVARLSGVTEGELPADELAACPALDYLPPLYAADVGVDHQVNNAAVIVLDPRTGEIKAMVGSLDYWNESIDGSFNVAVDGLRQPGSSFKPFTYLTALSQGRTAASMMLDVQTDFGTPYNGVAYVPQNYDRRFHGPMRMRVALANSYNVPAVEAMSWVGVDNVIRTAHTLGITSLDAGPDRYGLSLTLGGGEVKLLDMVYAFSVLDNMGVMVGQPVPAEQQRLGFRSLNPVAILRVEDRHGNVLYQYQQPQQKAVVTPQLPFLLNSMMSDRAARCPAFGCPNALELPNDRPAVAKTGTTNDFKDAWTVGYTPQLVTGVWVGNTDNSSMENVPGSKGAAPIWQAIMAWALQGQPNESWAEPPGMIQRAVCSETGLLPTRLCPAVTEYFIAGTEPAIYDNMYQTFQINNVTNKLATVNTPPHQIQSKVFRIFPDRAADWVRDNNIPQPPSQYDTITIGAGSLNSVAIHAPTPFAFVSNQVQIEGSVRSENFKQYRLTYFEGLEPKQVITLLPQAYEQVENGMIGSWDVSQLDGLYTLLLTVENEDGSINEASVQVTVDNTSPETAILFPLPDQQFFTNDDWIIVQAQATDNLSLDRVEFYVDGAGVPFAISSVPPFTQAWSIPGPGCHTFRVKAVDAAGNEVWSEKVPACAVEG